MALNLPTLSARFKNSMEKQNRGKEKMQDKSDHDYDPGKDDGSDCDGSVTPLKVCRTYRILVCNCTYWNHITKPNAMYFPENKESG